MVSNEIGIIYNEPLPEGTLNWESSRDVLIQVDAIEQALTGQGHETHRIPFTGDLLGFVKTLQSRSPRLVFNLCESVNEDPGLIGHPAAVLELLGIPFTGSPALALMLSTDKLLTKQLLQANNIRTPNYTHIETPGSASPAKLRFPVIIKPRHQDASIGIDQESICHAKAELVSKVKEMHARYGPLLVEEYIPGREFNIALYGFPEPGILPVAEIDFSGLPDSLFPIVGYRAKWDTSSVEYHNTPRIFPDTLPIYFANTIRTVARDCFRIFMLRDYGRVDIRVDARNITYVLEVNANPCLSPDAGFAAAARQKGIQYPQLIETLVKNTLLRKNNHANQTIHC